MKHLRLFENNAEFEQATLVLPNVSLVKESNSVNYKTDRPEQITYHFDFSNEPLDWHSAEMVICDRFIERDFSEPYNKIKSFLKKYGRIDEEKYGQYYLVLGDKPSIAESPLANPRITIALNDNGHIGIYGVTGIGLCLPDDESGQASIELWTTAPSGPHNGYGDMMILPTSFIIQQAYLPENH